MTHLVIVRAQVKQQLIVDSLKMKTQQTSQLKVRLSLFQRNVYN